MKSSDQPVLRDIVLVGGGHSHVGVLRMFGMQPMPGVRITVICTDTHTPYSGMLPGYIAGHYGFDEVHIDLARLAVFAGARLYRDEVIGIDRQNQRVICRHRPPVTYDLLSINIGSTPQIQQIEGAQALAVPVKPIAQFNQRWLQLLAKVREWRGRMTVAVVGGGATALWHLRRAKHPTSAPAQSNPDVLLDIGQTVTVAQWRPDGTARVQYRGSEWDAHAASEQPPSPGPHKIVAVQGNRLELVPLN